MSNVQCDLANLQMGAKLIYLGVFLRHTPRVGEGIILMHFHINSTFSLEIFPPCLTLNCMALQFVPLPAVMNMVLWEEKIETRPSLGGWEARLSLASKSNRALQKVALRNQNKNSFCNQWIAGWGLQSHKHQSQTNNLRWSQITSEFMT